MVVAALDLGTNSFLCFIAELDGDALREIHDESRVVRLGQDMYQSTRKAFTEEALGRAQACLIDYVALAKQHKAKVIFAVATSAARDSDNADELLAICESLGIELEIVSGEREAELSFMGSFIEPIQSEDAMIVDVGGGSTEFLFKRGAKTIAKSLDIGAVRLTEMFVTKYPTPTDQIQNLRNYAKKSIAEIGSGLKPKTLWAIAGTPTTLMAVIKKLETFDKSQIDQQKLTKIDLENYLAQISSLDLMGRLSLPGMQKGREDVIVAGICILIEVLDFFEKDSFIVSTRGVRYGLAYDLLKP